MATFPFPRYRSNMDDGTILAVLDVTKRELFISSTHRDTIDSVCMPDSSSLCQRLRQSLSEGGGSSDDFHCDELTNHNPLLPETSGKDLKRRMSSLGGVSRPAPLYSVSESQKRETEAAQDILQSHIMAVIRATQEFQVELMGANLTQQQQQQQCQCAVDEQVGRDMKAMADANDVISGRGSLISESELSSDDCVPESSTQVPVPSSGIRNFFASSLSTGKRQLSLSNRTLSFGKSALSASRDFFEDDESSLSPSIREFSPIVSEVVSHHHHRYHHSSCDDNHIMVLKVGKTVSASEQLLQYYTRLVASGSDSGGEDLEVVEEGDEVGDDLDDCPPTNKAKGNESYSHLFSL